MFNVTMKVKTAGFTLFEALIYIALFTLVIGGGVLSAYQIFDGQYRIQAMARNEAELNFVLRKLDWALSGATSVATQNSGDTLRILKDGDVMDFTREGETIVMILDPQGDPVKHNLPNRSLKVNDLDFTLNTLTVPHVLEITLTVDDEVIGPITRYVRTN